MRIEWKTPDEVREAAEPILESWWHLIPGNVRSLTISFDESDGATYAKVNPATEYRRVHLAISPAWLGQSEEERELTLVHELHHIPLQPMVGLTWDIIEQFVPESTREFMHEQWRLAFEGAVQDLTESALAGGVA